MADGTEDKKGTLAKGDEGKGGINFKGKDGKEGKFGKVFDGKGGLVSPRGKEGKEGKFGKEGKEGAKGKGKVGKEGGKWLDEAKSTGGKLNDDPGTKKGAKIALSPPASVKSGTKGADSFGVTRVALGSFTGKGKDKSTSQGEDTEGPSLQRPDAAGLDQDVGIYILLFILEVGR